MSAPAFQAIQTRYAGCHFRSRLEARWAVFFDQLSIRWEYEPQGFDDGQGGRYLPDFWLPELGHHAEVKGASESITAYQRETMANLIDWRGPLASGLLLLGPIPRIEPLTTGVEHVLLKWQKGIVVRTVQFCWRNLALPPVGGLQDSMTARFFDPWMATASAPELPEEARWEPRPYSVRFTEGSTESCYRLAPQVAAAYTAARSARFEHGETPR
jgi:hypothetical protein